MNSGSRADIITILVSVVGNLTPFYNILYASKVFQASFFVFLYWHIYALLAFCFLEFNIFSFRGKRSQS